MGRGAAPSPPGRARWGAWRGLEGPGAHVFPARQHTLATPTVSSRAASPSRSASMYRSGAFRPLEAALGVLLLHCVSAHVTFKLPSLPGVSPGNAGGYGAQMPARLDRLRRRASGRLACRPAVAMAVNSQDTIEASACSLPAIEARPVPLHRSSLRRQLLVQQPVHAERSSLQARQLDHRPSVQCSGWCVGRAAGSSRLRPHARHQRCWRGGQLHVHYQPRRSVP